LHRGNCRIDLGILHGVRGIPQAWITPIGHKIKTACLNLGELGYFGNQLPADIDDLTHRTERIARQILLRYQLSTISQKKSQPI